MTTKKEILDWVKSIAKNQDLIATKQNTERKAEAITTQRLLAEIFRELQSIKNILENAAKEPQVNESKPEREVIRLKDAAPLLGGLRNKSFNYLLKMGLEGYREGRRKCFIYKDSIEPFLEKISRRHKYEKFKEPKSTSGKVLLSTAACRAGIPYMQAKEDAIKMGIPLFKGNGTNQYLTEADSAKLVLKYKI